jgi:hypothetical protein
MKQFLGAPNSAVCLHYLPPSETEQNRAHCLEKNSCPTSVRATMRPDPYIVNRQLSIYGSLFQMKKEAV